MTEQPRVPGDHDLEQALTALARRIEFPPTPDIAAAVQRSLREAPRPRRRLWDVAFPLRRGLAVAALVLVVAAVALLALSPGARTAVADRLGLRGVSISYATPTPTLPSVAATPPPVPATPTTTPTPRPTPAAPGADLGLGSLTTLAGAQATVPFTIRLPDDPSLGQPNAVYLDRSGGSWVVSLVYAPRAGLPETQTTGVGLLLTELQGALGSEVYSKALGPETKIVPVEVNGGRGFWITGEYHVLWYQTGTGQQRTIEQRLAGNTLLWEQDGLTLRLEASFGESQALRVAGTVR